MSLSSRRAWIEIINASDLSLPNLVALLTESVDWNTIDVNSLYPSVSRSPHGERGLKSLLFHRRPPRNKSRSPHGERGLKSTDRQRLNVNTKVALLTESVDWNTSRYRPDKWSFVALLTESVDWNCRKRFRHIQHLERSLSSRRAWIEILSLYIA